MASTGLARYRYDAQALDLDGRVLWSGLVHARTQYEAEEFAFAFGMQEADRVADRTGFRVRVGSTCVQRLVEVPGAH